MTGGLASNLHRIVTFNLTNRIKMKSRHFQQMINLGHITIMSPSYVKSVFSVNVEDLRRAVDRWVGVSINWQFASQCVFDDPTDHLISPRARCQCSNISDTLSFIGDF